MAASWRSQAPLGRRLSTAHLARCRYLRRNQGYAHGNLARTRLIRVVDGRLRGHDGIGADTASAKTNNSDQLLAGAAVAGCDRGVAAPASASETISRNGSSSTARSPGSFSSSRSLPPCRRATAATRLKPEPGARTRATFLEPDEALQDALAIGRGDAGAAIGDLDLDGRCRPAHGDLDRPRRRGGPLRVAAAAVLDRVVDEVCDRLADELAIGGEPWPVVRRNRQREAGFLGERRVELGDVAHEAAELETVGGFLQASPASSRAINRMALNVLISSSASSIVRSRPSR